MVEWSKWLPLTDPCLSPLRVCPDGRVFQGVASDCSQSISTARVKILAGESEKVVIGLGGVADTPVFSSTCN